LRIYRVWDLMFAPPRLAEARGKRFRPQSRPAAVSGDTKALTGEAPARDERGIGT